MIVETGSGAFGNQAFWYFAGKKGKFHWIFRVNFTVKLVNFAGLFI